MSDPRSAEKLVRMARKDLLAMRKLMDADLETFGFHAQQACEKAAKAWLSCLGVEFPRIHELGELFEMLRENGATIPPKYEELLGLNPFGVAFRYDPFEEAEDPFNRMTIIQRVEEWIALVESVCPKPPQ